MVDKAFDPRLVGGSGGAEKVTIVLGASPSSVASSCFDSS